MKIEIDIDIEAIVREEIRNYIKENLVINNVPAEAKPCMTNMTQPAAAPIKSVSSRHTATPPVGVEWEYAKKPGSRRTPEIQALHELEVKLGRRLLPEEKGQTKAVIEMDEAAEEKAKQDAINSARINKMAEEAMNAATEELAKEAKLDAEAAGSIPPTKQFLNGVEQTQDTEEEEEATIPIAHPLPPTESLFK